jgi:proton-translocating NAD(P)+ transhydrogenase subunit alpha
MTLPYRSLGVPNETPEDTRVALIPSSIARLKEAGFETVVESRAGTHAGFDDEDYRKAGATVGSRADVLDADVLLGTRLTSPEWDPFDDLRPGHAIVGLLDPLSHPERVRKAAERGVDAFALDLLPRTSRAQSMDALSSSATLIGYKAVLLAADRLPKMFPLLTTAAGTLPAAQVFVIGAAVAGLTAIATARRLGAIVQAYDVRPAAMEEIKSVGARPVSMPAADEDAQDAGGYAKQLGEDFTRRQQAFLADIVAGVDVLVTTALIPGAPSPLLVTADAVGRMNNGTVIVDCAAERGGNCELTRADEAVQTPNGVTILGPTNLPATLPRDASLMYSKNVTAYLLHLMEQFPDEGDPVDDIVKGTLVVRNGRIVNERVLERHPDLRSPAEPEPVPQAETGAVDA